MRFATSNVIASLERRFPGLAAQVEMWDMATPLTFERYTGAWQGTFPGWRITTKTLRLRLGKTVPRLRKFYIGGLSEGIGVGQFNFQHKPLTSSRFDMHAAVQ
jgi:phytoene dehydrogenase-like protein